MLLKDHYRILELEPSASLQEIKTAYRRLALRYHPDKNNGDPYALEYFRSIKEAYEILTDPSKKSVYLQQRWYNQSTGKRNSQEIFTPVTVLKQLLELDKYVSRLDIHRLDKQGLYEYMQGIFSGSCIEKLNTFNDLPVNKEIVSAALRCITPLGLKMVQPIIQILERINMDVSTGALLQEHSRRSRQVYRSEQYQLWIILLLVLIISLLIFFMS